MQLAFLTICGLLLVGLLLRASVRLFQVLYIPAAVVGGVVGFALVQAAIRQDAWPAASAFAGDFVGTVRGWPNVLIAVVFAALLLERAGGKGFGEALRRGARSGLLAWVIILGQIALGLVVYLVAVRPMRADVPPSFGQLLEVSWAGGHGTSGAMAAVYQAQGFAAGGDLAYFLATVGLIWGVTSGLVLVNVAVRRGWTHAGRAAGPIPVVTGLEPRRDPQPIAFARARREVIDPLAVQVVILAAAFAVGLALQQTFVAAATLALPADNPDVRGDAIEFVGNIPLFLFTLLGGWAVRESMRLLRVDDLIDPPSIQRLVGVAMDVLIVAAVATMRVDALRSFFVPIVLLVVCGAVWSAVCLLVLAPRVLPRAYWFELGLLNYGFSTANTPQGFMLLRIVDPELKSGAAEDYAVAAPLSAPFVGGGVVTFTLPWVMQQAPVGTVLAAVVFLIVAGCVVALLLVPARDGTAPDAARRPPSPSGEGGGEGA